jgi:hypothetical protein
VSTARAKYTAAAMVLINTFLFKSLFFSTICSCNWLVRGGCRIGTQLQCLTGLVYYGMISSPKGIKAQM